MHTFFISVGAVAMLIAIAVHIKAQLSHAARPAHVRRRMAKIAATNPTAAF